MLCKKCGSTPSLRLYVKAFFSWRSQQETQATCPPNRSTKPMAAYCATLPKPSMAAMVFFGFMPRYFMASRTV